MRRAVTLIAAAAFFVGCGKTPPPPPPAPPPPKIAAPEPAIDSFDGLDWAGVSAAARARFLARANTEKCPCGSAKTLARCRKEGCAKALDRGRDVLEQCEGE